MAQQMPMINVGGSNLPPEIMQQQQALNRQQQMAQLLMQQGQSMPSGQMVSGRYVAPSFFQYAAPLFQSYAGTKIAEKGDKTALDLAKQLRQQYASEAQQYQNILRGQEQTFEQAGPTQTGGNIPNQTYRTGADPQAAYLFGSTAYNPVLQQASAKKMLEGPKYKEVTQFNQKTGNTEIYRYDENSQNPRDTMQFLGISKPEMTAAERANIQFKVAELADKGIGVNLGGQGTMPQSNMPQGGGQMGQVNLPKAEAKFAPSQIDQYIPDPSLTPEQNRAANAEFNKKLRLNIDNAKDTFGLLRSAAETLSSGKPSSGRLENIVTGTREFFGGGGEASKTDATLTILGTKLTSKVPRFEGPQSDRDTALYQAAAGDLGNANKPIATRLAAIQAMIDLNKKYYPNGDWESIDITGPVTKKNVLGGTRGLGAETLSPTEFRKTLSGADLEAFNFVLKNPNDKRTPAIKSRLGIE